MPEEIETEETEEQVEEQDIPEPGDGTDVPESSENVIERAFTEDAIKLEELEGVKIVTPPDSEPITGYDDMTVSELEDGLTVECSLSKLVEMLAYEKVNKDRVTAKDAIVSRYEEVRKAKRDLRHEGDFEEIEDLADPSAYENVLLIEGPADYWFEAADSKVAPVDVGVVPDKVWVSRGARRVAGHADDGEIHTWGFDGDLADCRVEGDTPALNGDDLDLSEFPSEAVSDPTRGWQREELWNLTVPEPTNFAEIRDRVVEKLRDDISRENREFIETERKILEEVESDYEQALQGKKSGLVYRMLFFQVFWNETRWALDGPEKPLVPLREFAQEMKDRTGYNVLSEVNQSEEFPDFNPEYVAQVE